LKGEYFKIKFVSIWCCKKVKSKDVKNYRTIHGNVKLTLYRYEIEKKRLTLSTSRFDFARGLLVEASQEGIGTTTFVKRSNK